MEEEHRRETLYHTRLRNTGLYTSISVALLAASQARCGGEQLRVRAVSAVALLAAAATATELPLRRATSALVWAMLLVVASLVASPRGLRRCTARVAP